MKTVPCNLCGAEAANVLTRCADLHLYIDATRFTLVRCHVCGLVYLNPQPTPEELRHYYPQDYSSYTIESSVLGNNRLLSLVRRFKRPSSQSTIAPGTRKALDTSCKTVLDFGSGNGVYLKKLRLEHPGWRLYGFDIDANSHAKERVLEDGITTLVGSPTLVWNGFALGTFDLINLSHVLEHLNDPKDTLSHLAILLKESGEMIIEVPNIDTWKFRVFGRYFSNLDAPRHLFHFSPQTLITLCTKAGLRTKNLEIFGSTKSTIRSIYNVLGIRNRKLDPVLYRIVDSFSKLIGDQRTNNDTLRLHCVADR